jgi:hypothetical protein
MIMTIAHKHMILFEFCIIPSLKVRKLKLQVAQRDNEINILVGMIKRRDQQALVAAGAGFCCMCL